MNKTKVMIRGKRQKLMQNL